MSSEPICQQLDNKKYSENDESKSIEDVVEADLIMLSESQGEVMIEEGLETANFIDNESEG